MPRCNGHTKTHRCRRSALKESEFCLTHQPEKVAQRELAEKRAQEQAKKPVQRGLDLQTWKNWTYQQEWKRFQGQPAYDYRELGIYI